MGSGTDHAYGPEAAGGDSGRSGAPSATDVDAIADGDPPRAVRLAQNHLAAARGNTLAAASDKTIEAKLISNHAP